MAFCFRGKYNYIDCHRSNILPDILFEANIESP